MATIRPNDNAPTETITYNFPEGYVDLGPGDEFESDDRGLLASAASHPWLDVEYPEVDEEVYSRPSKSIPYREDPFSEYNDFSNDPEKVEETERGKYDSTISPLAVEAGLDQSEEVVVDDRVAVTLAAADEADREVADDLAPEADEATTDYTAPRYGAEER